MNSRESALQVKFNILSELEEEILNLEEKELKLRNQYHNLGATLHEIELEIKSCTLEREKVEAMSVDDIVTAYVEGDDE